MKIDGRKLSHAKLEEIRFKAVKAVQGGQAPTAVAREMGLYTNRVFGKQIQWIYNTVTMKSPLQLKLPFALWTRSQIRVVVYRKFKIRLSLTSIGRLLAQLGLTCQKPLFRAYQQNPSLVEQWLKSEYPRIQAMAKREAAEIFFEDELTIGLNT